MTKLQDFTGAFKETILDGDIYVIERRLTQGKDKNATLAGGYSANFLQGLLWPAYMVTHVRAVHGKLNCSKKNADKSKQEIAAFSSEQDDQYTGYLLESNYFRRTSRACTIGLFCFLAIAGEIVHNKFDKIEKSDTAPKQQKHAAVFSCVNKPIYL